MSSNEVSQVYKFASIALFHTHKRMSERWRRERDRERGGERESARERASKREQERERCGGEREDGRGVCV